MKKFPYNQTNNAFLWFPIKYFIFVSICICSNSSYAVTQEFNRCIKDDIKFGYECAKLEYQHHSKRLKSALNSIMHLKSVNKNELQNQQKKWLEYRDKTCSAKNNTGSAFDYWQSCLAKLTESRANEVEKIINYKK